MDPNYGNISDKDAEILDKMRDILTLLRHVCGRDINLYVRVKEKFDELFEIARDK